MVARHTRDYDLTSEYQTLIAPITSSTIDTIEATTIGLSLATDTDT